MPETGQRNQGYTRQWLLAVDKQRKHFEDEMFETTLKQENVEKIVKDLRAAVTTKIKAQSLRLFEDDYPVSVQINTFARPHVPIHLLRVDLPNSVLPTDANVCVFVKDIKRASIRGKPDYEHTVKHYEALFRSKKIDSEINFTFMPLSQFLNEYASFDQRRKLTFLYDKFMVDNSIATKVNAFFGTQLMHDGRAAFPIDLTSADLNTELEVVLKQVYYKFPFLDFHFMQPMIQVGRLNMTDDKIAENIIDLVGQVGDLHPGGKDNVKSLLLRTNGLVAVSVEIYKSAEKKVPDMPKEEKPDGAAETKMETDEWAKLVERATSQSHFIVCADHFLLFEADDYTNEWQDRAHFDKDEDSARGRQDGNNANGQSASNSTVQRKDAIPSTADINGMILKNLQKLLGGRNVPVNVQSNGGGATANNAIRRRRGVRGGVGRNIVRF